MYTKGRSCSYYCKDDDNDDDDVVNYGITTPVYCHNVGADDNDGILIMILYALSMLLCHQGMVRCGEGVLYLTSPGRPTDIGLQLGKACYPCSR